MLVKVLEEEAGKINADKEDPWDQVHVTMGLAAYDPQYDHAVIDTVRRADKDMYENKRKKKAGRE